MTHSPSVRGSLTLQEIFESLPDERKIDFLKELKDVVQLEDDNISDVERAIAKTVSEFEGKKIPPPRGS